MRGQLALAMRALWPHRKGVALGLTLDMAAVAVESIAFIALAGLFTILLETQSQSEQTILELP